MKVSTKSQERKGVFYYNVIVGGGKMDVTQRIQKAIDFIEEHLTEKIEYEEVSKCAFFSSFHFQRLFGITCKITIGEYIRKRRLTLAGKELLSKKTKILDLSLKYGYETPESFSRAFFKFHGVMPSQVKRGCG